MQDAVFKGMSYIRKLDFWESKTYSKQLCMVINVARGKFYISQPRSISELKIWSFT